MREDMRQINKDEDRLQREIMAIHQKSLGKNARIYTKHRIDTGLKTTEDFLRKVMVLPRSASSQSKRQQLHQQKSAVNKRADEFRQRPDAGEDSQQDALMRSIENLDKLLANYGGATATKEQVIEQLAIQLQIIENPADARPENYAGRQTFTEGFKDKPEATKPTVQVKPVNQPEQQKIVLELKESNLKKLTQDSNKYE